MKNGEREKVVCHSVVVSTNVKFRIFILFQNGFNDSQNAIVWFVCIFTGRKGKSNRYSVLSRSLAPSPRSPSWTRRMENFCRLSGNLTWTGVYDCGLLYVIDLGKNTLARTHKQDPGCLVVCSYKQIYFKRTPWTHGRLWQNNSSKRLSLLRSKIRFWVWRLNAWFTL